jgi:hypothetical protein
MNEEGIDPETGALLNSRTEKPRGYYAVVASDTTNRYIDYYEEKDMDIVRDGDKVGVLLLNRDAATNPLNLKSIARPVDALEIPVWFKNMPFDVRSAEEKLVYKKLDNTFGVMGWDLRPPKTYSEDVFVFS